MVVVIVVIFRRTSANRADSMEVGTKTSTSNRTLREQRNLLIALRGFVQWSFWLE